MSPPLCPTRTVSEIYSKGSHPGHKTYYLCIPVDDARIYKTRRQASAASCAFVNSGRRKVDPSGLRLYNCPKSGRVIGLAMTDPKTGSSTPLVWLEINYAYTGVYFCAACLSDNSKKFYARVEKKVNVACKKRFEKYVKLLEGRSPNYIWDWWWSGFAGSNGFLRLW